MTKNLYVTPETEVLEVRFEENIMSVKGYGQAKQAGGVMTVNDMGDDASSLY